MVVNDSDAIFNDFNRGKHVTRVDGISVRAPLEMNVPKFREAWDVLVVAFSLNTILLAVSTNRDPVELSAREPIAENPLNSHRRWPSLTFTACTEPPATKYTASSSTTGG